MTLCARVFDLVAMAECAATGHRWVTVRPWGDVAWRECRHCGKTGEAVAVAAAPAPVHRTSDARSEAKAPAPALSMRGQPIAVDVQPRWSRGNTERDEAIVRMAGEGIVHSEIAALIGVHRTLIRRVLDRVAGIRSHRPDTTQRNADIARRVAAGERPADIAREIGIDPSRISQIVRAVAERQSGIA